VPCSTDNGPLLAIARALGPLSLRSLPRRSGLVEAEGVQRVEALSNVPNDQFGQPLRSADHNDFPLHSDEAFLDLPCRYVLLHCWQPDPHGGGVNMIARRESIERLASPVQLAVLRGRKFPYPTGGSVAMNNRLLRYNRGEIEGTAHRRNRPLDNEQQAQLDDFDRLFSAAAESIVLNAGDLLLIDNHRTLHGRTAFAPGSPRLLKRVRVEVGQPPTID
jgi:alpha-ketoglutarate-dependent taurine dioxygenase